MKPLYIFDLDGTLALIEHRRHFVEGPKKDWPAFHAACVDDKPNHPVIQVMHRLRDGADIYIFSGRSDEVREQTIDWLVKHTALTYNDVQSRLWMRKAGDYTPDDDLKRQWYANLPTNDAMRLMAVFDDRDRVVAMWRSYGITCFQVAPGDF